MAITPLHLEILLWHHTRCIPMENKNAPAVIEYTKQLLANELLCETFEPIGKDSGYRLTRKGEVWLEAILNTPFPVLQYVMPTIS